MKYIAICGTVGAGKTTLLQRLTAYFGPRAAFHEECPQDNPYINEYYSDSKRWSFHSQVSFLSLYFDDEKWRPEVGDTEFFFFDRAFLENLVIAKYRLNQQDLTQDEFDILLQAGQHGHRVADAAGRQVSLSRLLRQHDHRAYAPARAGIRGRISELCMCTCSRSFTTNGPKPSRRSGRCASTWTAGNTIE